MERYLLLITLIVVALGIAGLLTLQYPTGEVVNECAACPRGPNVCAVQGHTAIDYASACEARCAGARVIAQGYCVGI
jgi:hypothetical protein